MAISERKSAVVKALADSGKSIDDIAKETKLKPSSIRRYLRHAKSKKPPKILLIDIETAPAWIRVWGLYKQKPDYQQIVKPWFTLSWAAKWLLDKEVISDCVTPKEALARDDFRIVNTLWKVVDEAHIIIAHNLIKFDERKIMAKFIEYGLPRPRSYRKIDTLKQSMKHFAFLSHRLDYLNSLFQLKRKEDTDYQLWIDCEEGDPKALAYMLHYNKSDVVALEQLYLELRPYLSNHPNVGLYVDDEDRMCPHCQSRKVEQDGHYYTNISKFPLYRCGECGALSRGRFSEISKEKREKLLVSTVG